jgi:hypothetical protein
MATRTETALRPSSAGCPDSSYAVAAGLYVAVVVAPMVVLGLSGITSSAAVLYLSLLGAIAGVAAIAGWGVSRSRGLAVTIGRTVLAWFLPIVPFAWFVGVFGASVVGWELPDVAFPLTVIGTGGGAFLGIILLGMSRSRYTKAVLSETVELAQWEARLPQRWRYVAIAGMVATGILGISGLIAEFAFGIDWAGWFYWLIFFWSLFAGVENPRTFRVTEAGLAVGRPLQHRFKPWAALTGYTVTDDALVLQTTAWWRPAYRSDRDDIENLDTVVASLDSIFNTRR